MTLSVRKNTYLWSALAPSAVLSGVMFYRNAQLSESIALLEAKIDGMHAIESAQLFDDVERKAQIQRPSDPETKIDAGSRQADSHEGETRDLETQDGLAEVSAALAGALLETVEDLELQFTNELIDSGWGSQQEIRIQTEFTGRESLVSFTLSKLECRTTLCRGQVRSLNGQPFENYGTQVAGAMTEFESVDLVKMHIRSREADSAQVFFAKKDPTKR